MAKYESGDIVTFWFVVYHDPVAGKRIQAFSDNKDLVKAYLEFHKCPEYSIKSMTGTIDSMVPIINENRNDELHIENINTRDPNARKHQNRVKMIQIPITGTESVLLSDDSANFLNSAIPYSYLNSAIPYLKDKWQGVLDDIFLTDIIKHVIHRQTTKKIGYIDVDQLMLMIRLPQAHFGL